MGHSSLLTDVSLSIIFAAAASHMARMLKQPLILGYVLGGILLGSHLGFGLITDESSVELISQIGLILLLFIIGLEINVRDLAAMGRSMFALGFIQIAGSVALGLALLPRLGFAGGGGRFDALYLAVALSLSSTLIVVKLLHDKFEIATNAGRLTVGVLVLQDIWAIAFMAFQPNLLSPELGGIMRSFGQGAALVALAFLVSRHILGRLFAAAGKWPELVLLSSMAWCFLLCGLAERAGLSKEMGALIAGLSIAAFPYGSDVISKLSGVRDFFVTLFFVSLGLKVPLPSAATLGQAFLLIAFMLATRTACVAAAARPLGLSWRTGAVTAINLSQISEFSLVILALGAGYGHVSAELQPLLLTTTLSAAVLSTYLIHYSDPLARIMLALPERLGMTDADTERSIAGGTRETADIILLGCFREGESLLELIDREAPALKAKILVVDYNPAIRRKLDKLGIRWVYGDLAHPDTLRHMGLADATFVVCSVSDTFLKGTTNRRLLPHVKRLAPRARIVLMAETEEDAEKLRQGGAHDVVTPSALAATRIFSLLCETPEPPAAA